MENSSSLGISFYFKSVILRFEKSSISPLPSLGGVLRKKWLRCERRASTVSRLRPPCISYENLIDKTFIYQNRLPKVCKTTAHRVELKSLVASCSNMDAACPPQAHIISISFILACPRIALVKASWARQGGEQE